MRFLILSAVIVAMLGAKGAMNPEAGSSDGDPRAAQAATAQTIPDTMSSYDFALGRWSCKGITPQGKVDYSFAQVIGKTLNGNWFIEHDPSSADSGYAFWRFDAKRRLWVYLSIDADTYSMGTSPGWKGNTQTWTGYLYRNGVRRSWGRIIFKKVSDQEKREDFYDPGKDGKSKFVGSEVCSKVK